jgi:hypothetical protein
MKTILLCTDGSSFAENIYKYGAWFATQVNGKSPPELGDSGGIRGFIQEV